MISRADLESPEDLMGMRQHLNALIREFDDDEIYERRGIVKTLQEEYRPLYYLAQTLPGFECAHLTKENTSGPDAYIQLLNGMRLGIQITTAGEGHQSHLQRIELSRGGPVFPDVEQPMLGRSYQEHRILGGGRTLTSREANEEKLLQALRTAVSLKVKKFRAGGDLLLIASNASAIALSSEWRCNLADSFTDADILPYGAAYVIISDQCVPLVALQAQNGFGA
ncbi:hypothetical protein M2D07_015825 [Pseudomonas sp. BGr12]|uniref:hypothetical protein n=1 Tax=Pseudomonas sp. BGr12 TaxID=2936269 RepID=UPI00255971BF|nr:hypothetical protein [Pseudomonas sp. BJa5]MDL2428488.1 hypothetical protein [Pseudomonas sp. BJa5]